VIDETEWRIEALAGRLVEISGSAPTATLTAAASLILEAQRQGELAAWVGARDSIFFPPDFAASGIDLNGLPFAASGIDLNGLPVIRAADEKRAWRATDALLRSGGFAVVVIDLGYRADLPLDVQTRLAGLARKHHTVLLCITRKGRQVPSLGFKDKRQGPGWGHSEVCRGPDGLC
jgi:recombination protein RecA